MSEQQSGDADDGPIMPDTDEALADAMTRVQLANRQRDEPVWPEVAVEAPCPWQWETEGTHCPHGWLRVDALDRCLWCVRRHRDILRAERDAALDRVEAAEAHWLAVTGPVDGLPEGNWLRQLLQWALDHGEISHGKARELRRKFGLPNDGPFATEGGE